MQMIHAEERRTVNSLLTSKQRIRDFSNLSLSAFHRVWKTVFVLCMDLPQKN